MIFKAVNAGAKVHDEIAILSITTDCSQLTIHMDRDLLERLQHRIADALAHSPGYSKMPVQDLRDGMLLNGHSQLVEQLECGGDPVAPRERANDIEAELRRRNIPFTPIDWSKW